MVASTVISCLLSLINVGSTVAFNSLVSLTNGVLMVSYSICIGCFVWRRISNKPLLPSRFNLGKWGLPINLFSLAFLAVVFVMVSFLSLILSLTFENTDIDFGIRLADSQITTGIFPTGTIPFATDDELVFVSLHHRRYLGHRVLLCLGAFQICRAC